MSFVSKDFKMFVCSNHDIFRSVWVGPLHAAKKKLLDVQTVKIDAVDIPESPKDMKKGLWSTNNPQNQAMVEEI